MTIAKFINEVSARGIKLWQDNGQLKYKAAKGAWTDEVREQIIARKEEIIEFLSQRSQKSDTPPIVPVARVGEDGQLLNRFPLSFAQERLWFMDQLEPGGTSYSLPVAVSISGELNVTHLEQAFNALIDRHENLRTVFESVEGKGQQVILQHSNFKLEQVDLSQIEQEQARHQQVQLLCQSEATTPFDLSTGPLIRAKLFKLDDDAHVLMVTKHHIISDGWSMGVMIKELGHLMQCFQLGQSPALPKLDIQYVDYSVWQRKWLIEEGVLDKQLAYWSKKLEGVCESLTLTTDYPRQGVRTVVGDSHRFVLNEQLSKALKTMAESNGCTLYMVLVAAFNALLYRYTGQEDICVGSPIANRHSADINGLIGLFINTLAIRNQVNAQTSFNTLLRQVKTTCLEAYKHQDTPFEKIVDVVQPQRSASINPIFQIMIGLHNERKEQLAANIHSYPIDIDTSKLDFTLSFTEQDTQIHGHLAYKTSLFKPQTMARLAEHFEAMCRALLAAPDAAISTLAYISDTQTQQLLIEYNQTQAEYPKEVCIHQLFEAHVEHHADKQAVVFDGEVLTHQQLNEKSYALALYLQSLGVKPDTLVGLCVHRSCDMMVAILAILKAGAAYLPLDPDLPNERLNYMLEDSQVDIILTQANLQDKLTSLANDATSIITLDKQWPDIHDSAQQLMRDQVRLIEDVKANNLAYVIYTSGSTGRPKGVMIEHRMVVDYCYSVYAKLGLDTCDTFGAVSTFSADLGNISLFVPLIFSKTLVLFSNDYVNNPMRLKHYLDNHQIDCMKITPSHFEMFKMSETEIVAPAKVLIFAGEPLSKEMVEVVNYVQPQCKVYNNYGPTETTISKLSTDALLSDKISTITLGKPLSNTRLYVLDANKNLVPTGVPGELYIAGDGVARGYWNRPDLTASAFLPNPFAQGDARYARMYKTGDLVRWLDDGNIEYLGRADTQVKIRGFRIEVGEIEAQLNQYASVKESAVIVAEQDNQKKLVAYYVAKETTKGRVVELGNDVLRTWLQQSLPDYMLPATFVSLESMPLTPSGKVDRRALVNLDVTVESSVSYVAPRNEMEKQLAAIWADVLNLEEDKVGINDNFFELGGDSIKIIQIVYAASKYEMHFDANDMFDYQSIQELVENCDVNQAKHISKEEGSLEGDVALSPIQKRFFEFGDTDIHHYNQAVLLDVNIQLDETVLHRLATTLVKQHDALRLRFVKEEQQWQQYYLGLDDDILPEQLVGIHRSDISALALEQVPAHVETVCNQWQASLDLQNGPIMRWVWFDANGNGRDQLAIIIHHLAVDGVSWRILFEDFNRLLTHSATGDELTLENKGSSYRDWVESLAGYIDTEQGQADLQYWLAKSENALSTPDFFTDNALPAKTFQLCEMKSAQVQLSKQCTEKLLKHCHQAYGTNINDLLLTALVTSYYHATGNSNLVVDLEGHGREILNSDIDITKTLGWFTSIYPVHFALSQPDKLGQCIKDVKTALHSVPNKGVGYGIFRYVNEHETLKNISHGQVVFNFLGDTSAGDSSKGNQHVSLSKNAFGDTVSKQRSAKSAVTVNGSVSFEQLTFTFQYPSQWQTHKIAQWQDNFVAVLEALVEHCQDTPRLGFTPSDFALLSASSAQVDDITHNLQSKQHVALDNIQDIYPLTPLQSGILFETQLAHEEGNMGVYLTQSVIGIHGRVDVDVLQRAWAQIVHHYDALRMLVLNHDVTDMNTALQVILKQVNIHIEEYDLPEQSDQELKQICEQTQQQNKLSGIKIDASPLTRLSVFKGAESSYLLFELHHIVMDGWAKNIVFSNLFELYQSLLHGTDYQLPVTARYGSYVKALLSREQEKESLYWRDYLSHFEEKTPLPLQHLNRQNQTPRSAFNTASFSFSKETTAQLEQLNKTHRLTMNTVLQFVWGTLLHLHSGKNSVTFGSVSSGRAGIGHIQHIDQLVGLCINTTPTCITFDPASSLLAQLKQMQTRELAKLSYESTPLTAVQNTLGIKTNDDFFQTLFVYENYPVEEIITAQEQIKGISGEDSPNYPLTLKGVLSKQLSISLTWNACYFNSNSIKQLMEQFEGITLQLLAKPTQTVNTLNLVSESQKQKLLELGSLKKHFAQGKCMHQCFIEQVARDPNKIALVYEHETLSYQQLYDRSYALAMYIQAQGVKPDTLVGLYIDRSPDMLVGIMGILLSGGAYVPMDPANPDERISHILSDSQAHIVLTQGSLRHHLSALTDCDTQVLALDTQWSLVDEYAKRQQSERVSLRYEVKPEHLAYVIYTSGSTGKPKGVMVTHQNVYRLFVSTDENFKFTEADTWALFHSYAFDFSVWEIWGALYYGGRLVIVPSDVARSTEDFYHFVAEQKVTVLNQTPSAFKAFINVDSRNNTPLSLRYVIFGGEALNLASLVPWTERHSDQSPELINMYGITETTVHVTYRKIFCSDIEQANASSVIGKPLSDLGVVVLDHRGELAPVGVPGELYVWGGGVAKGYLNRAELTEERFVACPFITDLENEKPIMYRTGDLACWLEDGSLDYLGRIDTQVKIRGFRIELGEVEAQINGHSQVKDSAVLVKEHNGSKYLVAYYVARNPSEVSSQTLQGSIKARLQSCLPDYMQPAVLTEIDVIPLTINGKVDQRRLGAINIELGSHTQYIAPSTDMEYGLAAIWADVLGKDVSAISMNDNFFELGGHSLLATQLISKIQHQLAVKLPMKAFFNTQTLSDMSELLQTLTDQTDTPSTSTTQEEEYEELSL
ncbi:non-ribosomal peptide synthetase [Pseudoalteromonas sp. MMG022]|uniref:non-ribosomal peptide synthetase n=1 Tax=Pseudoalteromonas sp. MMG022 TaxID=2909978 RepID=UPI001F4248B5|nr:non-ribosomal peptide synthetase [Pseudoalteromonas sp. MMG022]MCF6437763.1 amino acid adenylation domain-containing protein [Pseudoalteromonas sp. MMG022]